MSFAFGPFQFSSLPEGNFAIKREYPWVSGLSIESLEIPGMERRRFLETNRPATVAEFDVILRGDSEEAVETIKNNVEIYLDPSLGPQRLVLDEWDEWYWDATVSGEVVWERLFWDCHAGYAYRATITFESYNDAAQRRIDEDAGIPITTGTSVELQGNTRAWPTFEVEGSITSGGYAEITVARETQPDFTVRVDGPLTSGQVMRLNYDEMQFGVWDGETKVASLVNRMSTLERLEIRRLDLATASVGFSGSNTGTATIFPNSRRQ